MSSISLTSKDIIYKQPREKFPVGCNFGNILGNGDSIVGIPLVSATPSGELSLENIFVGDSIVYATVGLGIASKDYRLEFECVTASGYIFVGDGILKVRDR